MLKISGFFYAKSSLRKAESKVTRHIFNNKKYLLLCNFTDEESKLSETK